MTVPLVCVVLAYGLILLSKLPVGIAQGRTERGYDNRHPRDQQAALTGWGRRALAAHQNSIEAFPPFAAAVLVSHVAHADPTVSAGLAVLFIVVRTAYIPLYLANQATLRSSAWGIGMLSCFGLFLAPLVG